MKKPEPKTFARLVLADLATIHAELAKTRMLLKIIARHLRIPNIHGKLEIQRVLADHTARKRFTKAMKRARLQL